MTETDLAIYELNKTVGELRKDYGIIPFKVIDSYPEIATPLIRGSLDGRIYGCHMEKIIYKVKEGKWT